MIRIAQAAFYISRRYFFVTRQQPGRKRAAAAEANRCMAARHTFILHHGKFAKVQKYCPTTEAASAIGKMARNPENSRNEG